MLNENGMYALFISDLIIEKITGSFCDLLQVKWPESTEIAQNTKQAGVNRSILF